MLYKIPEDCMVLLCVGNVRKRKNQGQLIRSFELLSRDLAENAYILFLGGMVDDDYSIDRLSAGCRYTGHYIACGAVDQELVPEYYRQGNAVALMSLSEGFGLSLIEGLHFGLPCMSFSDIDAFEDIYDESVMIGVEEHSDKAVAEGLEEIFSRQWSRETIIDYSHKFESQVMAERYVQSYKREISYSS